MRTALFVFVLGAGAWHIAGRTPSYSVVVSTTVSINFLKEKRICRGGSGVGES